MRDDISKGFDKEPVILLMEQELELVAAAGSKPGVQMGDPFPKPQPKPN